MEVGMEAIVLPPSSQPLEALDIAVDFTALVPLQLQTMLSEPAGQNIDQLNAMRVLLLGGAPLGHALESKIRKRLSVAVYHSYGMTETVSHIALRRVNGPGADSLYRVLEGVEIKTDERGCLMIRGAVSSYAWLQTNDLVEIIAADQFRWIGRADFVINSGGVKIHVEPLERKIEQLLIEEGWSISFILGSLPDEKLGQQLVMLLEGDTHSLPGNEEIRQLLRARLPVYEVPRALFVLPALLRTASGKIDRKANFRLINS
jgi:O-succinylbenzoic acid--CoA ligase